MTVVSSADSLTRGICQNLDCASSFEKTLAPDSCARIRSTDGRMCRSRFTHLLRWVRSTQIRIFSFAFGTTTSPAHQSVGCVTFEMTPIASMRPSSSRTLPPRGLWNSSWCREGIWHGVSLQHDCVILLEKSQSAKHCWVCSLKVLLGFSHFLNSLYQVQGFDCR